MTKLIEDDTYYVKEDIILEGSYVDGVWYDGVVTPNYVPFEGWREPYQEGEESISLPSGVDSSDAFILFTSKWLVTDRSLPSNSTIADVIYFENPDDNEFAEAYKVMKKGEWEANKGFKLISSFGEYLVVREPRE